MKSSRSGLFGLQDHSCQGFRDALAHAVKVNNQLGLEAFSWIALPVQGADDLVVDKKGKHQESFWFWNFKGFKKSLVDLGVGNFPIVQAARLVDRLKNGRFTKR